MKITLYKTVPKLLENTVKKLSEDCFPMTGKSKKEIATHKDKFDPSVADYIGHILAFDNSELIGRVIILKRKVVYGRNDLILGGIGGVCARSDKRRGGIATKLLTRAMKELNKAGCDVAYLCTNVDNPGMVKLYKQAGFVVLGKPHTYLGKSGKLYEDKDGMLAPVNSQEIFDGIMSSNKTFYIGLGNW